MAATKVTFTLDEKTVHLINDAAEVQHKAKSQIVREAVTEYHAKLGRLSESERLRKLRLFDALFPLIPLRPAQETKAELKELRRARRSGGRSPRSEER